MNKKLTTIAAAAAAALSLNTHAAVDMFLKLDGIDGESADATHTNEIDVLAWSWGMSQSGTTHLGAGSGAGKASFQDVTVTKYVDKSSVELYRRLATGNHITNATLVVRKAGKMPLEYIKIEMTDIIVTSAMVGGSGGEDRLTETVTLNFGSFCTHYSTQQPDGSGVPVIPLCFNIANNVEE